MALDDVYGVFYILSVGYLIAIAAFLLELARKKRVDGKYFCNQYFNFLDKMLKYNESNFKTTVVFAKSD